MNPVDTVFVLGLGIGAVGALLGVLTVRTLTGVLRHKRKV